MTSTHQHEPIRESGPWPYMGQVAPRNLENRAAHGNVRFTQHCACGAERPYLVNQQHYEWGVWQPSAEQQIKMRRRKRLEAARRLPWRTGVRAGHGITLRTDATVEELADADDTIITVQLYAAEPRRMTVGVLRQAARDWADEPGTEPHRIYTSIARKLP